jgi:putative ABC transport system permease protein
MTVLRLIMREILHRRMSFALSLLAVTLAVALVVAGQMLSVGMDREVTRLMRDLGFNVSIFPDGVTPTTSMYSPQFGQAEMPEQYLDDLAGSDIMSVRHLVARLQKRITWRGHTIALLGVRKEQAEAHKTRKPLMGYNITEKQFYFGNAIAKATNTKTDDVVTLGPADDPALKSEVQFTVGKVLKAKGTEEDMYIYVNLVDMQKMFGKPSVINEIQALSCHCAPDKLDEVPGDIEARLPGVKAFMAKDIAVVRAKTRDRFTKFVGWTALVVIWVSAVWVGILALMNVRDRRAEIGVLRAMGVGAGRIAMLFLGRAALLGLLGAVLGFALGTWPTIHIGRSFLEFGGKKLAPLGDQFILVILAAPLLCMAAAYLPAMIAATQDPAEVLSKE